MGQIVVLQKSQSAKKIQSRYYLHLVIVANLVANLVASLRKNESKGRLLNIRNDGRNSQQEANYSPKAGFKIPI